MTDETEDILANILSFDPIETRPVTEVTEMIRAIARVIPDELEAVLNNLSDMAEQLQWGRGDCANAIQELVKTAGLKNARGEAYTFFDVCYFVAIRYTKGQRSYNTIKGNALVARRFPQAVREKYRYEHIPFSHFAYAARRKFDQFQTTGRYKGKKIWQAILLYSWEVSQQRLYSPSERELQEQFEGLKIQPVMTPTYVTGQDNSRVMNFTPVVIPEISGSECEDQTFRPDLTDYRIYVELLAEILNEDASYRMNLTDVVKILIEQKMAELLPDVVVSKKRTVYQTLGF